MRHQGIVPFVRVESTKGEYVQLSMRLVFGQTRWNVTYHLWVPLYASFDGGGDVFTTYEDAMTTFDECVDTMWGQVL